MVLIYHTHPPLVNKAGPMKRITDYELVTGTPSDLTNRVRKLLRDGWEVHGPPASCDVGYLHLAQAMVKTADDSPPASTPPEPEMPARFRDFLRGFRDLFARVPQPPPAPVHMWHYQSYTRRTKKKTKQA